MRARRVWILAALTAGACVAASCNAILSGESDSHTLDACTPGASMCADGGALLVCSDGQSYTQEASCPMACVKGACADCVPGTARCSGLAPQTCSADGAWTTGACAAGEACASGVCAKACTIDGAELASDATNPANACESCQPDKSVTAWTTVSFGASCGAGKVCNAASCVTGCFVNGYVVASGTPSPNDPCQTCAPATSTTTLTPQPDGTSCGNGQICHGGKCGQGCSIDGTVYPSGSANPANACQACEPGTSTTAWTPAATGTPCGSGKVCANTTCAQGCFIGGSVYAEGAPNPEAGACTLCDTAVSSSTWSPAPDGTSCGTGGLICRNAACAPGCEVASMGYDAGAPSPTNPCLVCAPATSTTTLTNAPDGTSCGAGAVCVGGACAACEVTTTTASGAGSLSDIVSLCAGKSITFAPSLAGKTIIVSTTLTLATSGTTIDGAAASPLTLACEGGATIFAVQDASVTLANLTFTKPSIGVEGMPAAGLTTSGAATLKVTGCTLTNNPAGAISTSDLTSLTLSEDTLASNGGPGVSGGAVFSGGSLTVDSCTFAGNVGLRGGAIFMGSKAPSLSVTNSTFSNNSATDGGAIYATKAGMVTYTVTNGTFVGNSSSLFATSGSSVTFLLRNNIVDILAAGRFVSAGYNLVASVSGGTTFVGDAGDGVGVTPELDALGAYGGTTQTLMLMKPDAGMNPAIAVVPLANCVVNVDQRGEPRPARLSAGSQSHCDIGAVERQGTDTAP